ncbi:MAG: hypothetical protein HOE53_00380 [Candidatus Magasanikbacteria bacterium]|jgi:GMP synthase (glutamine-hydrolysing)|nr:hypothetical protein [Candidatus Magasanikbacteria bacterium]
MQKQLYIIQYRTDISKQHEQRCFLEEYADIAERIVFLDAITEIFPDNLFNVGGVILAGSGEFMLGNGDGEGTWKDRTLTFIDRLIEKDIPLLGVCFGYQFIALHYGASITNAELMRESGTRIMRVLEAAKEDPLFAHMPAVFDAQFGHKETIINLPDHLIALAGTDQVEVNSFRVEGTRVWGTLAHPEINPQRMMDRLGMYPAYAEGQSFDHISRGLRESPEATSLLHAFAAIVYE